MVTRFCVTMLIARSMVTQHRVTMPPPRATQCPIRANTVVDEAPGRYNAGGLVGRCAGKEHPVRQAIRCTRGFTLTEILMAVGILGIGLTMVASVFPVAVETSRRSNEATMTALCARSVAANLRARRNKVAPAIRDYFKTNATDATKKNQPLEINKTTLTATILPDEEREYNPPSFLYEQGSSGAPITPRRYLVPTAITSVLLPTTAPPYPLPLWTQGNYVAVIYATPINNVTSPASVATTNGPWRVTIVVYKSAGGFNIATFLDGYPRDKGWAEPSQTIQSQYFRLKMGPGEYMIDRRHFRGEAYMIESALDSTKIDPATYEAATRAIASVRYLPSSTTNKWFVLPGAVAVYHTVIGE
jgi:prepilin-type N-terminal cleavage/methylation domain-containing protein